MCSRRATIIVLDGVGCGELPDAPEFGDEGSNTLANTARAVGGLGLPCLERLGLGNITPLRGVRATRQPEACFGRMAEKSAGKDSTTGHWEIAGVVVSEPFPLFPGGFPRDLLDRFEHAIGRKTIGNKVASGTEIIKELGARHLRTGSPIVYTSADSVLQVACHEEVVPPAELYRICTIARDLCSGPYRVGRVIARPFTGRAGRFTRTPHRRDFSCPPPERTLLDNVKAAGLPVIGVGKVDDLFAHRGFTATRHTVNNREAVDFLLDSLSSQPAGLVFANLVQFDMDWGHRNNVAAFARGLEEFDRLLPEILSRLGPEDLLLITADHGNDPTTPSTDHSREYVPLLACRPGPAAGANLGTRHTFADSGRTCAEFLGVERTPCGTSFLGQLSPAKEA